MDLNRFSVQHRPPGDPSRLVEHGNCPGYSIQVVTGYDAVEDRYPVHVYLINDEGTRIKLALGPIYEETDVKAFARGWAEVDKHFPDLSR